MPPSVERSYASAAGSGARQVAALQQRFADALFAAEPSIPSAVAAPTEAQIRKRFDVYRNNVNASLSAALAARFPVVERIVGDEFFRAMALVFIEQHPPRSPVLAEYGGNFANFLDTFEPVAPLVYLADTARLEWQRNVSYHAADADAVGLDALAGVDPARLSDVHMALHPAAGLVLSHYPVARIWASNTHDDVVGPIIGAVEGEAALVTRPGLDVLVTPLPPASAQFAMALADGEPLGVAVARVSEQCADFDLAESLTALFGCGAIAAVHPPRSPLDEK